MMNGNSPYILRSTSINRIKTSKTRDPSTNTDTATPGVLCANKIQVTVTSITFTKIQNNCRKKMPKIATTQPITTPTTGAETIILPNVTIRLRGMPTTKNLSTTRAIITQIKIQLEIDFYLRTRQMATRFKCLSR